MPDPSPKEGIEMTGQTTQAPTEAELQRREPQTSLDDIA